MSTITDIIDCPQCGYPAQEDTYYVVGEEYVSCPYCGYSHKKIGDTLESSKGYGTMHQVSESKNENGSNVEDKMIRFTEKVDLLQRSQLITELSKYSGKSSLYVWNEEQNKLETLVGIKPQTIEERFIEQQNESEYYKDIEAQSLRYLGDTVDFN